MLNQLKKVFSSFLTLQENNKHLSQDYHWFKTKESEEVFGIAKEELTKRDLVILHTFLESYNPIFPPLTSQEKMWKKLIHEKDPIPPDIFDTSFRFVYFTMPEKTMGPNAFKEAIYEVFEYSVPIIWENEHEGIIIEDQLNIRPQIMYSSIIDILMSDLYIKINLFVGPIQHNLSMIHTYYQTIMKHAHTVFAISKNHVISYIDAFPYLLLQQSDIAYKDFFVTSTLQEYADDKDMLHTLQTFFECNLNLSVTAKKLYMHRNSLQYRLDKFTEVTGIDIRNFQHALTVYLAILSDKI
ncbi:PucR family transcriptional regulator [Virgibacillus soli]|uniref:Helix-turn-helix domain-containing protein n=1 Tax=Paracerasibacillus soli TaxID=480284 RepID=A0ABU5CPP5_9BACI|nr:helix-turn-helix domain-containing protein [Virgibacillus soli]MDY0407802.1 helix-turn-helix domain-containing protein [Virgibacillus soli]